MSRNRVQLSLVFNDSTLYDNFIEPWKKNKELNPLILKLLDAYYYSEDIRNSIDCYGQDEVLVQEANKEFDESLNRARQTLAFMNMLSDNAQSILDDGLSQINDIAKATGGMPAQETEYGMGIPSFGEIGSTEHHNEVDLVKTQKSVESEAQRGSSVTDTANVSSDIANSTDERFATLEAQMNNMCQMIMSLSTSVNTMNQMYASVMQTVVNQGTVNAVPPVTADTAVKNEPQVQTVPDYGTQDDYLNSGEWKTFEYEGSHSTEPSKSTQEVAFVSEDISSTVNTSGVSSADSDSDETSTADILADLNSLDEESKEESKKEEEYQDGKASLLSFLDDVGFEVNF